MVQLEELFGEASEIDTEELGDDIDTYLLDDEEVREGFVNVRSMLFFTQKRLLVIRREGFTGSKREYHSVPYPAIRDFSLGTPGRFENEAELRVWLTGRTSPLRFDIDHAVDEIRIHDALSRHVLD